MGGRAMLRYVERAVGLCRRRAAAPPSSATKGCWEAEGLEFGGKEDGERCAERAEFVSLPTQEELEEAAFVSHLVVHPFSDSQVYGSASLSNSLQQSSRLPDGSTSLEGENTGDKNAVDWMEPELHPCNDGLVRQLGNNNVLDAFQLLQTSPVVQEIAISLASNKAIRDALLKNERVQEFSQLLQRGNSELQEVTGDSDELSIGKNNVFIWAAKNAKMKLMDYMEKITELISDILAFADKSMFAERDGHIRDRTLKSSILLSIIVLLVVAVKRA